MNLHIWWQTVRCVGDWKETWASLRHCWSQRGRAECVEWVVGRRAQVHRWREVSSAERCHPTRCQPRGRCSRHRRRWLVPPRRQSLPASTSCPPRRRTTPASAGSADHADPWSAIHIPTPPPPPPASRCWCSRCCLVRWCSHSHDTPIPPWRETDLLQHPTAEISVLTGKFPQKSIFLADDLPHPFHENYLVFSVHCLKLYEQLN